MSMFGSFDPVPPQSPVPLDIPHLSLNSPPSAPNSSSPTIFESLPQELIEQIAFQLCRLTPLGPPAALLPLLLVSRRFHNALGPNNNDGFYADLFKERFDWRSVERRWAILEDIREGREKKALLQGREGNVEMRPDCDLKLTYGSFTRPSSPSDLPVSTSPWRPLTNRDYALEMRRRCTVLRNIRRASMGRRLPPNSSRPSSPRLQPMTAPGSFKLTLSEPDDLTQNLWTCYLMLIENDGKNLNHLLQYADLRTYTTLFYNHSLLHDAMKPGWPKQTPGRGLGLWIGWLGGDHLPSEPPDESDTRFFVLKPYVFGAHKFDAFYAPWTIPQLPVTPKDYPLAPAPCDPFSADLRPATQAQTVIHMGRRIELAPPILAHAAIFSFFYRIEQDPEAAPSMLQSTAAPAQYSMGPAPGAAPPNLVVKPAKTSRPKLKSKIHDHDFVRLASCVDPYSSLGLPTLYCRGDLTGSWEGRFSFFDFDSYRDMLGGRMRSLYEGPFGDQPQVWKLEETVVRTSSGKKGGTGPVLNAGFEVGQTAPRMAPVSPAPATLGATSGSGSAFSTPSGGSGAGGRRRSLEGQGDWLSYSAEGRASKRSRSEPEDVFSEEWEGEQAEEDAEDYEILLTGSGHSAWGQFVLKGRVRSYDGMFSITKEYLTLSSDAAARDSRGRWLYRGYCVGGKLVGRWRDTHTPQDLNGYEGTFSCHRRTATAV